MTKPARKPRKLRTFSAFGDVRRMPSEYEIVTHAQNWNTRDGRLSTFEQNTSSPLNLWFLTYRENSPFRADNWDGFRDPDQVAYRSYVNLQAEAQTKLDGMLDSYGEAGADDALSPEQVQILGSAFTPSRYLVHGFQQAQAYVAYMGPSSYVTSAGGYANADFLRRVTMIAYRTRSLQIAHPDSGIGSNERSLWEQHPAWQPAREAIERALVAYDWGEAFTALDLVLAPTLDDVLIRQFGEISKRNGDDLSWLVAGQLGVDSARRNRWCAALARHGIELRADNEAPLRKWINRWAPIADAAAAGIAELLGAPTDDVVGGAQAARERLHAGIFDIADDRSADDLSPAAN
ncbi:putative methane/phenol/toluene monooxygenase [Gordonia polyisoprenivorans VH2]|uniref:propane 2-monooxygenase n=1 Tax=Gordonia polyisoprenivorans (strain DSM 44266 / VH2) TaxID=1112204 RepID=H6MYN3_GORPV|nr:toluene hydroxylase [Gordonia polyisoprenivorans]AFA71911.1 putative methane/phenol/toluene monooxygenase [Gordonia polyisoprenivorans VH2]WCB38289.1 toluene hydroxylase [Gordonia polyisoprenivorans]